MHVKKPKNVCQRRVVWMFILIAYLKILLISTYPFSESAIFHIYALSHIIDRILL